jgi:[ribosomal protein S5]-alanine N-acetyltransferase
MTTTRFILRDLDEQDVEGMFALDNDPDVHTYLGNRPIRHREEAQAIIDAVRMQYRENGIGRWAIIDKATNEFVGWTGLKYEQSLRRDFRYYDLGYRLRKKYWGQGIATETALASLYYGFTKMNLSEIYAAAHIDHAASNRVLRKVGLTWQETFVYDGSVHNWYKVEQAAWMQAHPSIGKQHSL